MPHKINDLSGAGPAAGTSVGTSRAKGTAAASSGAPAAVTPEAPASPDVHITDTASFLASLEPTLREAPAVDAARVAAVRSALEQGHYAVDPGHVATQLTQMEQALGQLSTKGGVTSGDEA